MPIFARMALSARRESRLTSWPRNRTDARRRLEDAQDEAQQRALAAAALAHDDEAFLRLHGEVDAVEDRPCCRTAGTTLFQAEQRAAVGAFVAGNVFVAAVTHRRPTPYSLNRKDARAGC